MQQSANATELTRRIQSGSRMAEAEFMETYSDSLMPLLLKRTQSTAIAEDCRQQTMLITLTKIRSGGIRKPASLRSFLRRTAINVSITHYRKEKRYTQFDDGLISI